VPASRLWKKRPEPFSAYSFDRGYGANLTVCANSGAINDMNSKRSIALLAPMVLLAAACTPTVKVEAPDKPIEINMNVNIKHEILVKVEKEVEAMFEDEELF
jgi:hypothetical protein